MDSDWLSIHRDILLQESQLATELTETDAMDSLVGSPSRTGASERLGDLTLGSDDEHEITMISADDQGQRAGPAASEVTLEMESGLASASKHIVRQDATEQVTSDSRTSLEKAKSGVRASLAFLEKIAKKDSSLHDGRDRHLLRKHRKNVARFERIHGSVGDILGIPYPAGYTARAAEDSKVVSKDNESSPTLAEESSKKGAKRKKEGNKSAPVPLNRDSMVTAKGAKTADETPSTSRAMRTGKVLIISDSHPQKGVTKGITGTNQSTSAGKSGDHRQNSAKPPNKGVVKRVRSGDDQKSPAAKRTSQAGAGPLKDLRKETTKRTVSREDQSSTSRKLRESSGKDGILAAVIDRMDPDGRISVEKWQVLENKLLDEIFSVKGRPDEVSFKGADWARGVKTVSCGNQKTFEFLKAAIGRCGSAFPEARLDVILASELPLRPVVTVWIPPPIKPVEVILGLLDNQNDGLTTGQWKLIASLGCKENQGRDFRFAVDQESLKRLKSMGGVAVFGLGSIKFRFPKDDRP